MEFVTKKTNKKKRKEGSKPGNSGKDGFWTNLGEVLPGTPTSVGTMGGQFGYWEPKNIGLLSNRTVITKVHLWRYKSPLRWINLR